VILNEKLKKKDQILDKFVKKRLIKADFKKKNLEEEKKPI
jgi:hypothetical protein